LAQTICSTILVCSGGGASGSNSCKTQEVCTTTETCTPEVQVTQESCPQGYTGEITKTSTKTCPQNNWTESTVSSCTKSLTNPTNPVSPVSPLFTLVSPTPTLTVTAPTTQDVPNSETTPTTSQTKSTASETPTPKSNIFITPLGLSLGLLSKELTQLNVFPSINISQELPNDIKIMQSVYMDLITNGSLFNPDQTNKLKRIASDAVELEQ
jgi:hypothetical protein